MNIQNKNTLISFLIPQAASEFVYEMGPELSNSNNIRDDGMVTIISFWLADVVGDLRTAWDPGSVDDQLCWAVDVLAEYFDTVDRTLSISNTESEFADFLSEISYTPSGRVAFPRHELDESPVSLNAMKQLAVQRTSTRWFQNQAVTHEKIDEALKIAMQSPSACNRQSYEYRLYDDRELIDEISSLAIGASGYSDNITCLAVIVGKQRAYFNDRDKHVIYIDASL